MWYHTFIYSIYQKILHSSSTQPSHPTATYAPMFFRICSTSISSILKAFSNSRSGMGGFDVNNTEARSEAPGFWLLSAERVLAVVLPTFCRKWTNALGNTNTSPPFNISVNSLLLVSTNLTTSFPLMTNNSSDALAWLWGGITTPSPKSDRAMKRPCVFIPGKFIVVTGVTELFSMLFVFPGAATGAFEILCNGLHGIDARHAVDENI